MINYSIVYGYGILRIRGTDKSKEINITNRSIYYIWNPDPYISETYYNRLIPSILCNALLGIEQ